MRNDMGFTKLYSGLVFSTVWREPLHIKVVWVTLLAMADANGNVSASIPGLAAVAGVTIEQCQEALERLSGPDRYSRTKDHEGRRIKEIDGGWNMLNYAKYRAMRDEAARREQTREATRRWRKNRLTNAHGDQSEPRRAQAEAEAEERTSVDVTPNVVRETDSGAAARAKSGSWTEQACDDWIERHGGTAPGGRIGRHLKTLVSKHGWDVVRKAWRAYLAETEPQYATPDRFSATFGTWNRVEPKAYPGVPPPEPPPPVAPEAPQDDTAREFGAQLRERLRSQIPANNWATWIRPLEGWAWLDDGAILELAAPSRQHAEMLRGLYREKLRSAAAELGKQLKFKVFVHQEEPTLHNGSVR